MAVSCAPGDVVECEIERIGVRRNPVLAQRSLGDAVATAAG